MSDPRALRTRWAAIGAAVAVSLGGGITLVAQATNHDTRAGLVPIEPCRLMDTRPSPNTVGPRSTAIGAGETHVLKVHGAQGQCNIPPSATAIAANVTVTGGTAASFLTLFPGPTRPLASNLNWRPGEGPRPNHVTVRLSAQGDVRVYNDRGTVNVVIDVVGFFDDLDGRYASTRQTIVVDGLAFVQYPTPGGRNLLGGCPRPSSGSSAGYFPVPLPVGARVLEARVVIREMGVFDTIDARLERRELGGTVLTPTTVAFATIFAVQDKLTTMTLVPAAPQVVTETTTFAIHVNLKYVSSAAICRAEVDIDLAP